MSTTAERPWLSLYDESAPPDIEPEHPSALAMFASSVERAAIRYYDAGITWNEPAPRQVIDEIPKTATGKILRRELRDGGGSA